MLEDCMMALSNELQVSRQKGSQYIYEFNILRFKFCCTLNVYEELIHDTDDVQNYCGRKAVCSE